MQISDNIRALRQKHGMTQEQFADALGVTRKSVFKWESGQPVRDSNVVKMMEVFGVEPDDIKSANYGLAAKEHGSTSLRASRSRAVTPVPSDTYAPIVGAIHAGEACEAIQDIGEELWVPPDAMKHENDIYYLKVTGDSMNKVLPEGSMALVDKSAEVKDGDIGVVFVNGDEATIKRVFFAGDTIVLHPESTNGEHYDRAIDRRDPDAPEVRIDGRVIWYHPEFGKL